MSQQMRQVGNSLDRIGWRHVTEGKVSIALREMQADYLRRTRTQMKIDRWMKGFLDKLLTLSHTQWLCRNLTKHHNTKGAKALAAEADIRREIEQQLAMGADSLPADSRCLLEISTDELFGMSTVKQQYWLNAAVAARAAAAEACSHSDDPPSHPLVPKHPLQNKSSKHLPQTPKPAPTPAPTTPPIGSPPSTSLANVGQNASPTIPSRTPTDRLNILCRNTEEDLRDIQIADLLNHSESANLDMHFSGRGGQSICHRSLKTLNPSLWVTDEVINSFLLKVLHPSLRSNDTYFFNSFFFSALLSTGSTGRNVPTYDFSAVSRWGNKLRRKGGVLGLKELFVPINHQNVHWLFLRVHMAEKTIVLWDPQGRKRCNQLYLQTMLMYLGDVYRAQTGQLADDWKSLWTLTDASESAPKQYNGFDCGIFTLTNITLLAQHIPLHVQSYSEATFLLQDTRKRIALLLWKASRNRPRPTPPPTRRPGRSNPTTRPTKTSAKLPIPSASSPPSARSSTKERNRRRRQNNKRLVIGKSRAQGKIYASDPSPFQQMSTIINRKRSAASVAQGGSTLQATTQRHAPPKRKKRQRIS